MKGFTHTLSMICAAMLFMNALPLQTVQAQNTVISANIRSDEPKGAFNKITVKNAISDSGATIVRFVTKAPSIKADTILLNDDASVLGAFDVSGFDTSSVMNMNRMFGDCSALAELDVSGFKTGQVTKINRMFSDCNALTVLDLSIFDIRKVTQMDKMLRLSNLDAVCCSKSD